MRLVTALVGSERHIIVRSDGVILDRSALCGYTPTFGWNRMERMPKGDTCRDCLRAAQGRTFGLPAAALLLRVHDPLPETMIPRRYDIGEMATD